MTPIDWLANATERQRARYHVDAAARVAVVGESSMGVAISRLLGDESVPVTEADLVIAAAPEQLNKQRAVLRDVEAVIRQDAVIAVHTSAVPLKLITSGSQQPERIVGTRFLAPVERTRLLEIIQHDRAANQAIATAAGAGVRLGKTIIVVGDGPGFFTSRVLAVMLNEAALLVEEGARVEVVDAAMTGFGFPVGPLRLLDELGLDVAGRIAESLVRAFGDRIPRSRAIATLVSSGHVGRKSGAGFYLWPPGGKPTPNPAAYGGAERMEIDEAAIQTRLGLIFVNETIRCLEDGVLRSVVDGELGAVLGPGFPPVRGGPFHYADSLGLQVLGERLSALAAEHGTRYAPPELLLKRARDNRAFIEES